MTLTVVYTTQFTATVEVPDGSTDEEIMDAVCDIDVPEGGENNSIYKDQTFSANSVKTETGKIIL